MNEIHAIEHPGRPTHWFVDDTYYFLTASTDYSRPFLNKNANKAIVRDLIWSLAEELGLTIEAWVILDNHYHLLFHLLCDGCMGERPLNSTISHAHLAAKSGTTTGIVASAASATIGHVSTTSITTLLNTATLLK